MIEGLAPVAVAGRADDFSWSQEGATALATAIRPPEPTIGKAVVPAVLTASIGPSTPPAPPAVITTLDFSGPPLAAAPTALPTSVEALPAPEAKAPVKVAEPAPLEDPTIAAKGRVSLQKPDNAADASPQRASPSAAVAAPKSSGPPAEGAPTALPAAVIEVPVVEIELPAVGHSAPTVVAALPAVSQATGARDQVPNRPVKAERDAAPNPSAVTRAVKPAVTSGPAASAVPMEPPAQAEDLAEAKENVGKVAVSRVEPSLGKSTAPTDPDARAQGMAPNRAAPAMPSQLPMDTGAGGDAKAPPIVVARLDAAPVSVAPSMLVATEPEVPEPADTVWPLPEAPQTAAALVVPAALPAPTLLPQAETASLSDLPPALPTPPQTPVAAVPASSSETTSTDAQAVAPGIDELRPTISAAPATELRASLPETEPAEPASIAPQDTAGSVSLPSKPIMVPETDISALLSVPADLTAPATPSAPSETLRPAVEAEVPSVPHTPEAEVTKAAALPAGEPETLPEPVAAPAGKPAEMTGPASPAEAPIIVPEIDISALTSVPSDLTAPAVPQGDPAVVTRPAETAKDGADSSGSGAKGAAPEAPVAALTPPAAKPETAAAAPALVPHEPASPILLPEIDLSALRSVPPDLTEAKLDLRTEPHAESTPPAEDEKALNEIADGAAVPAPALPSASVDEIPAPRIDMPSEPSSLP